MNPTATKFLTTIALAAGCFSTQAATSTIGGAIYNPANGHNYYLVGQGTWSQTEAFAMTLGGHLVTINDAAENSWLVTNFLNPNPTINPWIGLHDQDNNNVWEWISGEPVGYLNWAPGEPNFSHERVSNIFPANHSAAGLWNNAPDAVASGVIYGIVEVPEPSTLALGMISCVCWVAVQRRSK